MRIKKNFQGEIPQNKIMGVETASDTDTYSCNYINEAIKSVHSTKEQIIGTWEKRDGSIVPHYRKTIYIDSLPNGTTQTYNIGVENLDYITHFYGSAYKDTGHIYQMTLPNINAENSSATVGIGRDNNNIQITAGADRSSWWGQITVEYIKTTD